MKSDEARKNWAAMLRFVENGGNVIIEHYNRPIARIAPMMATYTYGIEISDDGVVWMPENAAAIGTEQHDGTAEEYGRDVLNNWVDDLPRRDWLRPHRRIVVWAGEQQDTVPMAECVIVQEEL
jgi:antitoxin (DNA-binding transcriptional repressor) of toxin-antitoxin stability system